jgi:hypothetical protein
MSNFLVVVKALWLIISWWANRDVKIQANRKKLMEAVDESIKNGDTRSLHRVMAKL